MKRVSALAMLTLMTLLAPDRASAVTYSANLTQDLPDANPGDGVCSYFPGVNPPTLCTLRAAIMEGNVTPSNQSVSIILSPGVTYILNTPEPQPQGAAAGDLDIIRPMEIGVPEGAMRATIDANQISRIFQFHEEADNSRLYGIEIVGGFTSHPGPALFSYANEIKLEYIDVHGNKGGVDVTTCALHGAFNILDSHIHENGTEDHLTSGVCTSQGALRIERTTINDNWGRGIVVEDGSLWLHSSTVSGAAADSIGIGVSLMNSNAVIASSTLVDATYHEISFKTSTEGIFTLTLTGTIVAATDADPYGYKPCYFESELGETFVQAEWNLYSDNSCISNTPDLNSIPKATLNLSELDHFGGPAPTMIPLPGSDAIDRAPASVCEQADFDQRGLPRPVASVEGGLPLCDIGAVELTTMPDEDLPPNGIFVDGFEAI